MRLQPPLPSLGNRSGSPTQLGSLADNVRPSVPIILAPSPDLNKKAIKPVQPVLPTQAHPTQITNESTENSHDPSLREDCTIDLTPVIEEDQTQERAPEEAPPPSIPEIPPKTTIYDI
jgi:hypothetical protein